MTQLAEAPTASRRRRVGGWVVLVVVVAAVGIVGAVLTSLVQWTQRDVLDPGSAGPRGTRAIASLLADRGVDVDIVRDRQQALTALGSDNATLVLGDSPYLSDRAFTELTDAATDVVLIDPASRGVRVLFPGAEVIGFSAATAVAPSCDLPEARRAGRIVPGVLFAAPGEGTACYPDDGGGAALLVADRDDGRVSAIDGTGLFDNEHLAENGNAALAVNLLGRLPHLVWYVASAADSDLADTDPSLGDLTPGWVSPVIVVALCAGLAAAVWRGRRFGPLVTENLPVTVRASETTEGRARLYARSRDAVHAVDQVRIGALGRIARLLGLGPTASASGIADSAAERLGADRARIRAILLDELPRTDGELLALGDSIRDLEAAVRAAVRPGPSTSSGTEPTSAGTESTSSGTERNNS